MRSQQPDAELIITYIFRNQTINYTDNMISVFENGTKRYGHLYTSTYTSCDGMD